MSNIIPLEISARHIHLSQKSFKDLFGQNHTLRELKPLSQTGEFAARETVDIYYQGKSLKNVRVVGPIRKHSQLELTLTDCWALKLVAPINLSGDLTGAPIVFAKSKHKKTAVKAIVAQRHLHTDPSSAKTLKIKNNQKISVLVKSPQRSLIFQDVVVRVKAGYNLAVHIDTDEANAAGLKQCSICKILK